MVAFMAIKSFNVEEQVYRKFSEFCKANGISMSKQIEFFMRSQLEEKKRVRGEYLKKLDAIRKGKFISVKNINDLL